MVSLTLKLQLKSLMEREALQGNQSNTTSPSKSQQEELFLYPAESSTLTTLPGVARVVHSKASCTVHWLESGKNRPNTKELPAAQILGIHTAPPLKTGAKSGRGGATAAGVGGGAATVLGECPRTEPPNPEPSQDSATKVEEKRPSSSQQTEASRKEFPGTGPSEGGGTGTGADACGGVAVARSVEMLFSGADGSSEQCKEEHNTSLSSPEASHTPPGKATVSSAEEGLSQGSAPAAKERPVEQIREEGWSSREADSVTLAELYLMFGKPGKLQLEYEWQPASSPTSNQDNGQALAQPKPNRTHRVLRCLLKLVTTEVNPKPLVRVIPSISHLRCSSVRCLFQPFVDETLCPHRCFFAKIEVKHRNRVQ